jgi:uncharacterized membrane protein YeaQ/YmgE (transglycosylase-associated protein family)
VTGASQAGGEGGHDVLGALLVGLVTGIIVRALIPLDVWRHMRGPRSWLYSMLLGLAGAIVGYLIFTVGFGIGDTDIFDWGGILGAIIGGIFVLICVNWYTRFRRMRHRRA